MGKRVLISGAGIAGLSAGAALGQAGHTVEIVEARSGPEAEGEGLCLPGNALRALRKLNLLDAVAAAGFAYDHNIFCDSDGTAVATVPCRIARKDTPVAIGIRRSDLHEILLAAAQRAGARITYGSRIRALDSAGSSARVRFSGGRVGTYDLVLGCDGVHSTLRRYVSPDNRARFASAAAWRVIVPRHESITAGTLYCRPDGRAGLIPLDPDTMYLFAIARATRKRPDPQTLHTRLAEILSGYGGLFPKLVDRLGPSDAIVYSPIEDVSIPGSWHRGRVLLMGDAAHATTPYLTQGAGMALEDAIVLAAVLATERPVKECLDVFMHRRLERCRFVQQTSRRLLAAELADPAADRNTVLNRIRRMPENFAIADAILDRSPLEPFPFATASGRSYL